MSNARDNHIIDYNAVEQPDGSWLHDDGDIYWYSKEGVIYGGDGPAIIWHDGSSQWHNELGQWHRDDGPAVMYGNGEIRWWANDTEYTFDEWCIALNKSDEEKMLLRLQYE
jgi:hypothetical protein